MDPESTEEEAFQDIDDTLQRDVKRWGKRMHAHRQCLYAENVPARIEGYNMNLHPSTSDLDVGHHCCIQ